MRYAEGYLERHHAGYPERYHRMIRDRERLRSRAHLKRYGSASFLYFYENLIRIFLSQCDDGTLHQIGAHASARGF